MKISVCGKGGSGKSTIVSLLAERFAAAGKEVLIIDSDESNYGLHRHLSMENPKEFTGFFGGKEEVLKDMILRSDQVLLSMDLRILLSVTHQVRHLTGMASSRMITVIIRIWQERMLHLPLQLITLMVRRSFRN